MNIKKILLKKIIAHTQKVTTASAKNVSFPLGISNTEKSH